MEKKFVELEKKLLLPLPLGVQARTRHNSFVPSGGQIDTKITVLVVTPVTRQHADIYDFASVGQYWLLDGNHRCAHLFVFVYFFHKQIYKVYIKRKVIYCLIYIYTYDAGVALQTKVLSSGAKLKTSTSRTQSPSRLFL